jgi:RimJ/RimL family protein N-acetyltransferase
MSGRAAIETARLVLRGWREEDRAPFAAMCADPEVMRHFPAMLSRAESDALIDRVSAHVDAHGFGLWAVERKADGAFLGFTGMQFVAFPCPIEGEIEIGWRLASAHWRQGYAREAAEACLDWFDRNRDEPRIVSMTISDNRASWGLMERLGLRRAAALDFDHPRIDPGTRCCRQIVYVKERPL